MKTTHDFAKELREIADFLESKPSFFVAGTEVRMHEYGYSEYNPANTIKGLGKHRGEATENYYQAKYINDLTFHTSMNRLCSETKVMKEVSKYSIDPEIVALQIKEDKA
jgi:hypothetical protein